MDIERKRYDFENAIIYSKNQLCQSKYKGYVTVDVLLSINLLIDMGYESMFHAMK